MIAAWKRLLIWCKANKAFWSLVIGLILTLSLAALVSGHTKRADFNRKTKSIRSTSNSKSASKSPKSKEDSALKYISDQSETTTSSSASSTSTSLSKNSSNSTGSNASSGSQTGSDPEPDPESKLEQVVTTSSAAAQGSLPDNYDSLSCSSMSALYVYGIWEHLPGSHEMLVLLYDPEGSLFNQYQVEFNMDEGWQDTHRVRSDLVAVQEKYPVHVYTGFGSGGWESRLMGAWTARVYLDAPDYVWDSSQEKYIWQGEGDTTLQGLGTFELNP